MRGDDPADPVLGRLVTRGLQHALTGSGYAIVEGVDGPTCHLRFPGIEMTGDAMPGAIVEARTYADAGGRKRLSLATRSDLTVEAQITATVTTWFDQPLVARKPAASGGGFGAEARDAMEHPIDHLAGEGLARRQGERAVFARDLINTLRRQELNAATAKLSAETGLSHRPSAQGASVAGVFRQDDAPKAGIRREPELPAHEEIPARLPQRAGRTDHAMRPYQVVTMRSADIPVANPTNSPVVAPNSLKKRIDLSWHVVC